MIIDRVEQLVKEKGLKIQFVCSALGLSRYKFADIRRGRSSFSDLELKKLANLLEVSPEFIKGETSIKNKPVLTDELLNKIGALPAGEMKLVPLIGTVKAGYGGVAFEEHLGFEKADVNNPEDFIYFKVKGESMEPMIADGSLALVRRQSDIESGDLAVVIVDGEEGTLKKVLKDGDAVILQSFNPKFPPRIIRGNDLNEFVVVGKVTETKKLW